MAKFIQHTSCPKCGSKDNRALYSDGSSWCFGCHDYGPPKHREFPSETPTRDPPKDLMKTLPFLYDQWLTKYNLTPKERSFFQWSPSLKRLVTTLLLKNNGVFWEGRSLTQTPKSLQFGKKPYLVLYHGKLQEEFSGQTIVLTEDFISALKVSRYLPAMPLFGNSLSNDKSYKLSRAFQNIHIWLDADKYKESLSLARELSSFGNLVTSIYTQKDPKDYDNLLDILKSRDIITNQVCEVQ